MSRIILKAGFLPACFAITLASCKTRDYNQPSVLGSDVGDTMMVTVCAQTAPHHSEAAFESKANVRVACQGQCKGADYRTRRFFISNEEKIAGFEFAVKTHSGKEIRNFFVYRPSEGVLNAIQSVNRDHPDIKRALTEHAFDPETISEIAVPSDGRLLLMTGTKASLSGAGLFDGGTLDCGGQPVDGAVVLKEFREQSFREAKKSAALP